MAQTYPHLKARLRMERVARLEAMMIPDAEIAAHVNLSPAGLASLKARPEYQGIRLQVASGVLSEFDAELANDVNAVRASLRANVPAALQAIVDAVHQKTDPKLRFTAACELLDREGNLAKVSRTGVPLPEQGGSGINTKDDDVANELISAMGITPQQTDKVQ